VPAAFCVTTDAYRAFLGADDLTTRIAAALEGIADAEPEELVATAAGIRSLLIETPTPPQITDAVVAGYAELERVLGHDVAVSVRSSATAEDLPGFSFAGQQDTYLYVSGREPLLDAVKRCWASLWTDRAIAYRQSRGFDHGAVYLAVVVQEMFPSEVSGVLFTANPVTSNPDEFVLNASWGLGEAVVSGQVNPDQLVVAKGTYEIVDRRISDKTVMTAPHPSGQGSHAVPVPDDLRATPCLTDAAVGELCAIGQRIEDHYGFYQDVEWGWAGARFAVDDHWRVRRHKPGDPVAEGMQLGREALPLPERGGEVRQRHIDLPGRLQQFV
jgi:pyruvate,water dikinase